MTTIEARSPLDDALLGRFPEPSAEQVRAAMARARAASGPWGALPVRARLAHLARLRGLLVRELDAVVDAVRAATGKPRPEALSSDLLVCVDLLAYYEGHAEQILAPRPRGASLLYKLARFEVRYEPLGVVAIFSPWNHPLQLSLGPAVTALAAGNAVLLKPSELTPGVGALVVDLCRRAGLPPDLVQALQGGPAVGQALIAARPDKIFFTGGVATGKKVMAAAAEHLIPLALELGGKDPMIVFDDAPLARAARGAAWGAFAHAGQNCVSTERLYVQRGVYHRLVSLLVAQARAVRPGLGPWADMGPVVREAQAQIIEAHIDDALARGATLATGRRRAGNLLYPVVLLGVDHGMRVMQEETFGPVLPVMAFDTEEQAVALANDSRYGLNASVWTRDLARGRRVARRLVAGSCAINDVLKNIANPHTPFGGERHSGFGRSHGPEGLRGFSRTLALMACRGRLRREPNWFPYGEVGYRALAALIRGRYGEGGAAGKTRQAVGGIIAALRRERQDP